MGAERWRLYLKKRFAFFALFLPLDFLQIAIWTWFTENDFSTNYFKIYDVLKWSINNYSTITQIIIITVFITIINITIFMTLMIFIVFLITITVIMLVFLVDPCL